MIVAVHQPEFLPWIGFFNKMARADVYIVLDHVQFKRRYFENRNRIVAPDGKVEWLGVPVKNKGKFNQAINTVLIDYEQPWKRKLLNAVHYRYSKAPGFVRYFPEFEELVMGFSGNLLVELNVLFIDYLRRHLDIATPTLHSSAILAETKQLPVASALILELCLSQRATHYLCGPSGRDYLDLQSFSDHGIEVIWQDFVHPVYPQLCASFEPYLSAIDLLLCAGADAARYIISK